MIAYFYLLDSQIDSFSACLLWKIFDKFLIKSFDKTDLSFPYVFYIGSDFTSWRRKAQTNQPWLICMCRLV